MSARSDVPATLGINWAGRTVVGKVRKNNEDTLWAAPIRAADARSGDASGEGPLAWPGVLFAVADGMGGALAGEVASALAVTTLGEEMRERVPDSDPRLGATVEIDAETLEAQDSSPDLVTAVETANQRIRGEGETNPHQRGMGTTLTAVWACGGRAEIAQVGDSRAYLFRGGRLAQLTKDQSLVGKLIEDGIIAEDEAEKIAGRNIILQALGSEEDLEVAHEAIDLAAGDWLMLCTDGLSGVVSNRDIEAELRRGGGVEAIVGRLIAKAEERGGPDNITVLVAAISVAD